MDTKLFKSMLALFLLIGITTLGVRYLKKDRSVKLLKVGISVDNPPFVKKHNGAFVGFDVDLALYVGNVMGKQVELIPMNANELLKAVDGKVVDMALSGISISVSKPASVELVQYIAPISSSVCIVHIKGTKIDLETDKIYKIAYEDLSPYGSILDSWVNRGHYLGKVKSMSMASKMGMIEALQDDAIDGIVLQRSSFEGLKEETANAFECYEIGSGTGEVVFERYGIAVLKGSSLYTNIATIMSQAETSGKIDDMRIKWIAS